MGTGLAVCEFPGALVTGMFWAGGNSSDSFPFAADWAIMCSVISSVWKRMMVSRSVHNGLSIVLRLVKFLMMLTTDHEMDQFHLCFGLSSSFKESIYSVRMNS